MPQRQLRFVRVIWCGSVVFSLAACGSSESGTPDATGTTAGAMATGGTALGGGGTSSAAGASTGGASAAGDSATGGSSGLGGSNGNGGAAVGGAAGGGGSSSAGSPSGGATGTAGSGGLLDANETELKAFPTAEGYGRHSKGGRGGKVLEVTNLNDSGAGSLRAAVEASGARTVVFNVSGLIELKSKLIIKGSGDNGTLTVAGQTAPGKGIAIKNYSFGMVGGSDVIMRFVRVKVGDYSKTAIDGMGMSSADNTIYDHCSISWTIDEAFSSRSAHNITLQRTLISECLNDSYHYDDSTPDHTGTQPHGFAASISGNVGTFHHNLLAHCAGRNWSLAGGLIHGTLTYDGGLDIRNNVVYNWQYRTTDGGAHQVDFVNNYYKPGPASTFFYALNAQNDGFEGGQYYYFTGNVMPGHFDENSQDKGREATGKARDYNPWVAKPFFDSKVTTQSAGDAYQDVLANVGANVPTLDDHDKRVIQETKDGTTHYKGSKTGLPGLPDTQGDVGGYEAYPMVTRPADWDTDHDGMPDAWEKSHGLDASDASDGNKTNLSKVGYTNLEMYLNELAGDFK